MAERTQKQKQMNSLKKLSVNDFELIKNECLFFDFYNMNKTPDSYGIKVTFNYDRIFTDENSYSFITQYIHSFLNNLLVLINSDKVYIAKYSKKWVINKHRSRRLYRILKCNNIKNTNTILLLSNRDNEIIFYFIKSVLIYNSFVQFITNNKSIIITVTDHIDVFIHCKNKADLIKIKQYLDMDSSFKCMQL